MSITDADLSVPLTTTWVEKDVVLFAAGTLSSISTMVTEVESKLRRGTLTTTSIPSVDEVNRWLIRAKQELMETKRYSYARRYAYAATVAGTYRYALPPDYNGGELSLRDTTNNIPIEILPEFLVDLEFPDIAAESRNESTAAIVKGMELWLVPPPSGIINMELEYQRSGDDGTATSVHYLPEIERFRCCDFALWHAFSSVQNWDAAAYYKALWVEGVGKSMKAESRRKWGGKTFQAINCFQEHNARFAQRNKP